jgi:hypothetical protein
MIDTTRIAKIAKTAMRLITIILLLLRIVAVEGLEPPAVLRAQRSATLPFIASP